MKAIEATVDKLLVDLYGKDKLYVFDGLNHDLKLDYLKRQSEELEELHKQGIMRMEGVTLSYDILQSKAFLKVKDIFEELKEDEFVQSARK